MAMGNVYQASAHSLGLLFENAVAAQQQLAIAAQAATVQGVMQIYSVDTTASAAAIAEILRAGDLHAEAATPPAAPDQAED
jgi:hypothetical protein